jgi:hypothetical protein
VRRVIVEVAWYRRVVREDGGRPSVHVHMVEGYLGIRGRHA